MPYILGRTRRRTRSVLEAVANRLVAGTGQLVLAGQRVRPARIGSPQQVAPVVRDDRETLARVLVAGVQPGVLRRQPVARHELEADLLPGAGGHDRVAALPRWVEALD